MGKASPICIKVSRISIMFNLAIIFALSDLHATKTKQERSLLLNVSTLANDMARIVLGTRESTLLKWLWTTLSRRFQSTLKKSLWKKSIIVITTRTLITWMVLTFKRRISSISLKVVVSLYLAPLSSKSSNKAKLSNLYSREKKVSSKCWEKWLVLRLSTRELKKWTMSLAIASPRKSSLRKSLMLSKAGWTN